MGAVRDWRRATLGGAGVALLLPLAIGIALLGSAAVGNEHALRSLGQVFAGPTSPGRLRGASVPGLESARNVPALPRSRHRRIATAAAAVAAGVTTNGRGGGAGTSPSSGSTGPSAGINAPSSHGTGSAPSPGSGTSSPGGGGGSTAPPPSAPPPSPVHAAGQQVADTAKSLPGPAGPATGDAVQTVVDLLP